MLRSTVVCIKQSVVMPEVEVMERVSLLLFSNERQL